MCTEWVWGAAHLIAVDTAIWQTAPKSLPAPDKHKETHERMHARQASSKAHLHLDPGRCEAEQSPDVSTGTHTDNKPSLLFSLHLSLSLYIYAYHKERSTPHFHTLRALCMHVAIPCSGRRCLKRCELLRKAPPIGEGLHSRIAFSGHRGRESETPQNLEPEMLQRTYECNASTSYCGPLNGS